MDNYLSNMQIKNDVIYLSLFPRHRCSQQNKCGCRVVISSNPNGEGYLDNGVDHNHDNMEQEIVNMMFKSECKKRVSQDTAGSTKNAYDETLKL